MASKAETTISIACHQSGRSQTPTCLLDKRKPRNKYLLDENRNPAICVFKTLRRARYIALKKGKQKETKERHCKNETTFPGNIKCQKISLSEHQTSSPAVMYVRLQPNKRYKPGDQKTGSMLWWKPIQYISYQPKK